MKSPVTPQVIRQALSWQGITVSHVRFLSAFIDMDSNTLADILLYFNHDDICNFADSHGLHWQEVMAQEFAGCVESSFCSDFGVWNWHWDKDNAVIVAQVSFLLYAHQTRPEQLPLSDVMWDIGEQSPF